jgi:hypothetical protein
MITPKLNLESFVTSAIKSARTFKQFEAPERELIAAVNNGAKDIMQVSMYEEKLVDVIGQKINTLFTFGLGGCNAVSVIARNKTGTPIALMSHHPPSSLKYQCGLLECLVKKNEGLIDFSKKAEAAVVLPGKWAQTSNEKWIMEAYDKNILTKLQETINKLFKNNNTRVIPYDETKKFGQSNAFIINFPKKTEEMISYQALEADFGDFGKLVQ